MPGYTHTVKSTGPFLVVTNSLTKKDRYISTNAVVSFEQHTDDCIILALSNGENVELYEVRLKHLFFHLTEAKAFS